MFSRFGEGQRRLCGRYHPLDRVDVVGKLHPEQVPALHLGKEIVVSERRSLRRAIDPHIAVPSSQTALLKILRDGLWRFLHEKLNLIDGNNDIAAFHRQPAQAFEAVWIPRTRPPDMKFIRSRALLGLDQCIDLHAPAAEIFIIRHGIDQYHPVPVVDQLPEHSCLAASRRAQQRDDSFVAH